MECCDGRTPFQDLLLFRLCFERRCANANWTRFYAAAVLNKAQGTSITSEHILQPLDAATTATRNACLALACGLATFLRFAQHGRQILPKRTAPAPSRADVQKLADFSIIHSYSIGSALATTVVACREGHRRSLAYICVHSSIIIVGTTHGTIMRFFLHM